MVLRQSRYDVVEENPPALDLGLIEYMVDVLQLLLDEQFAISEHLIASKVATLQLLILLLRRSQGDLPAVDYHQGSFNVGYV